MSVFSQKQQTECAKKLAANFDQIYSVPFIAAFTKKGQWLHFSSRQKIEIVTAK